MFSVIIPVFNKVNYIEKCIGSVLAQTFTEFELLLIDDGSTDGSFLLCQQFTDSRIKCISQKNTGVAYARNNGVALALYDTIAFLDADDWWHPDFLQEAQRLLSAYPAADLYGMNYYYVKNGQYRIEPKGLPVGFIAGYIDYIAAYSTSFCVPINCSFVIVRRSAFLKEGGFRSTLRLGEDFDLWIRLALHAKVAYLNKALAYSNQDVETSNRAIGGHKLYPPTAHFIFNLAYLRPFERESTALKQLLDGLRVRSLLPYYLSGHYATEVKAILTTIDFDTQPRFFQLVYSAPIQLVRLCMWGMKMGSRLKKVIRHRTQL